MVAAEREHIDIVAVAVEQAYIGIVAAVAVVDNKGFVVVQACIGIVVVVEVVGADNSIVVVVDYIHPAAFLDVKSAPKNYFNFTLFN